MQRASEGCDHLVTFSVGGTVSASNRVERKTLPWSKLVKRLTEHRRSDETADEYLKFSKRERQAAKEASGYLVPGYFSGDRRKKADCQGAQIAQMDFDKIDTGLPEFIDALAFALPCTGVWHTTHSHRPDGPKVRVFALFSRVVLPEEFEPLMRKLAEQAAIAGEMDPISFRISQAAFLPSCPHDIQPGAGVLAGPVLDPDEVLGRYDDWRDAEQWPIFGAESKDLHRHKDQAGDPLEKPGVIGLFCRAYPIQDAIERWLPDVYTPTRANRYTYTGGSTHDGAAVYEDRWLYSWHATDPATHQLVNAFDLVRLHKFGDMDDDAKPDTPTNRLPSYLRMADLVNKDEHCVAVKAREGGANAADFFQPVDDYPANSLNSEKQDNAPAADDADDRRAGLFQLLSVNSKGTPDKTITNLRLILLHDPALADRVGYSVVHRTLRLREPIPGHPRIEGQWDGDAVSDNTVTNITAYIASVYGVDFPRSEVFAHVASLAAERQFNPIGDYLDSLVWDGVPRLDDALIRHYGADDNAFTRLATRRWLVQAVRRAYEPGCAAQHMLVLQGPQGLGKSAFFRHLGGQWFSESMTTFTGKEACESVQGFWLVEVPEMQAMRRSEVTAVKAFVSKQVDSYRAPYARIAETHPRVAVFGGTTNESEFLEDDTGNRRYWVMFLSRRVDEADLAAERDQLLAEAVAHYRMGEPITLYDNAEAMQIAEQQAREAMDDSEGLSHRISEWVNTPRPADWYTNPTGPQVDPDGQPLRFVWSRLIWVHCLGRSENDFQPRRDGPAIRRALISSGLFRAAANRRTTTPDGHRRLGVFERSEGAE